MGGESGEVVVVIQTLRTLMFLNMDGFFSSHFTHSMCLKQCAMFRVSMGATRFSTLLA